MRILPKKVLIFGRWYKVTVEEMETGDLGNCDSDLEIITVNSSQNQKKRMHTFLHEFGHALIFRTGVFQGVDMKIIEVIVDAYATALLENFKITKRKK